MSAQQPSAIVIDPLREEDRAEADRIFRLAFGTFLGIPDPTKFAAGTDFISTRWKAAPETAFAARHEGRVVGSNFAAKWGAVGFFGPLTIHPDYWDRGIGKRLLEPVMQLFSNWNTLRH